MKKLAKLSPGRIFNFAGEKFVVMEQRDGAAFVLLAQSKESCPFNDKDDAENRNDYTRSTLKERIDKWVEALPRTSEEAAAILPFEVDLSCTDRSKSYGTITVKAAPLTLWQYGQFKELIPLNEDDWYWLVTPWACRWLRSPLTYNTYYVWVVNSNGDYYYDGGASSRTASAPLCFLTLTSWSLWTTRLRMIAAANATAAAARACPASTASARRRCWRRSSAERCGPARSSWVRMGRTNERSGV